MNKLKILALLTMMLASFCEVQAKTTTATVNGGNWLTAGTWNNGLPVAGDIIIIPAGITVNINGVNADLRGAGTTTVNISGVLRFSGFGALDLDASDAVNILSGGSVTNGDALGGFITFGNPPFWLPFYSFSAAGVISSSTGFVGTVPFNGPRTITSGGLPITLVSFEAEAFGNQVRLSWRTASELNNDFFSVERLNDKDEFDKLLSIPGKGTTNEESRYEANDPSPLEGKNYYRLKQTDFDGQFSYSDVVMVDFKPVKEEFNIYPNPSNQQPITIEIKQLRAGQEVPIKIRSSLGVQAYSSVYSADSEGNINVLVSVENWPQGLYLVQLGSETGVQRKIVIK